MPASSPPGTGETKPLPNPITGAINDEGGAPFLMDNPETPEPKPKKRGFRKRDNQKRYDLSLKGKNEATQKSILEAQGALMVVHRLLGKNMQEIAQIFGCSQTAVKLRMSHAARSGMLDLAQDLVKQRLMPKALAVYETKLEEGDLDAARDILFGAGVLEKNTKLKVSPDTDSLAAWRQEYQRQSLPGEVTEVKDEEVG